MAHIQPGLVEHQFERSMRPDWQRWMSPDACRYLRPDAERTMCPEEKLLFGLQPQERRESPEQTADIEELLYLRDELAVIKAGLRLRRVLCKIRAYNPNQPRAPAGNPDGGQWTGEQSQGAERVRIAQLDRTVTDDSGRPYYRPGGHHEMPEGVYKKWKSLSPETRKVFQQSSTGELGATIRTTPEDVRQGNVWDGEGGLHLSYNQAVEELGNRFIEAHKLNPDGSDMSPAHAVALLKEIRESEDPRIRDFNANMRRIQRLRRLRGGPDD